MMIPVRIDVTSDDKSIRIVDTLLMDPTCWPIPLYHPLQESLERNITELGYVILSETEVLGMGRTVRHFTGRVELYSEALQQKIEAQLRPQLKAIALHSTSLPPPLVSSAAGIVKKIHIRLVVHGVVIQEDILWDPSVPVSPWEFAKDNLGKELNLPDEAIVAVATTILEQLYDLPMDTSPEVVVGMSSVPSNNNKMGAWMMDPKEHVATVAHMVAQHRP
jgi:hypothetical protein